MNDQPLSVADVARLLGWAESTVRKHAAALGAKRKGARKWQFTEAGVRAGVAQLRIPNDLQPLEPQLSRAPAV